jgi:hypothetical protein
LSVSAAIVVAIEVTPTPPPPPPGLLPVGLTRQFTATGILSDASTQNLTTQVLWASSAPGIAFINNAAGSQGLATAVAVGTTTLSATFQSVIGPITGTAPLSVSAAIVVAIEVTPPTASVALGSTGQFRATGFFTDNSTRDITPEVLWNSSNPGIATISNAAGSQGLATSVAEGVTTITATKAPEGISDTASLTVTPIIVAIEVTPTNPAILTGFAQQFTAVGIFSDGTTQFLTTQVLWASSALGIATISNAAGSQGLATAVAEGTTTISATFQGLTGSTTLTVQPDLVVISPTAAAGIRLIFTGDPKDPFLLSFLSIMAITEDRTVLEFDISELGGIEQAILVLPLRNLDSGGPIGIIDVFTYSGDGTITADEFFAGTLFTSFANNGDGTASVDVTEAVQASESNFLGFRLSTTTSDRYDLGSLAGLPEPTLRITF